MSIADLRDLDVTLAGTTGTAPVHVTPPNDTYPHEDAITCPCGPRVEQHERKLIIHNAWDGRP